MLRHFTLILLFQWIFWKVVAQQVELSPISYRDFELPTSSVVDSSTHAVVIYEKGKSDIQVDEYARGLRVVHHYGVRIKILDKEGFDKANYVIPLYKFGGQFETVSQIKGYTHHLEKNKLVTTEMDKGAVFEEKVNDFVNLTKFTLPNITEDCIIDIQYEVRSPDIFNYRTWTYQDDIPKLYSEYVAIIPATYEYNVTLTGFYKLTDQKSKVLRDHFLLNGRRFDCSALTYLMKDIPAFEEESYMLAPKNYKAAITFELMQYYTVNGTKHLLSKEWKDVDRELLNDKSFGGQMKKEKRFSDMLATLYAPDDTDEEKARKIYQYVKKKIRWNKVYGKYSQHGVKEALENGVGNIGDINLSLIAAYNAADIEAYPVLLSTRENGLPNSLHPVISDFNYVVAQVRVQGKAYFLDASEENIPFGLLPLRCINGNGRIIYSKKSSEWIKLQNKQDAETHFDIIANIDKDGVLKGSLSITYRGLEAFYRRNHIRSFSSIDDYIEERMNNTSSLTIVDGDILHLDTVSKELIEHYDIQVDMSANKRGSNLQLNPIFINRMTKNPFNLAERNYPVDLGSRRAETYTVSIRLPEGYSLMHQPKDRAMTLPEGTARYTYISNYDNNILVMKQKLALNKAIYAVEEYFHLKEFYSRIIQHQKIDFTFKSL